MKTLEFSLETLDMAQDFLGFSCPAYKKYALQGLWLFQEEHAKSIYLT